MSQGTATQTILALARTFPCLEVKLRHYNPEQFDADEFHAMIGPWSSGERLCALFILNVWNPGYAKSQRWTFNLFDFVGTADPDNRQALLDWIQTPIWP